MAEHIFISYSRNDREYVERLTEFLRKAALPTWFDGHIPTGERFDRVVAQQIDECSAFVVVMTPSANDSTWVTSEIERARATGKPILPLLLHGQVFMSLGHAQYEDVSAGIMPSLAFLARLGQHVGASRSVLQQGPNEKRAMNNLPQRSYDQLVGRSSELDAIIQKMRPYDRTWVVVVDGIGGVGKTTLALEAAYQLYKPGDPDSYDAVVWMSAKKNVLTADGIIDRQSELLVLRDLYQTICFVLGRTELFQVPEERRWPMVKELLRGPQRILIVLDNLEEVDDRHILAFLQELPRPSKAIVTTRHRIDVAFAMRLEGLDGPAGMQLIRNEANRRSLPIETGDAALLQSATGGVPLAIVWSLGLMSLGHSIRSIFAKLASGHSDIAAFCFAESVAALGNSNALRVLAVASMFEDAVDRELLGEAAGLESDIGGRDEAIQLLIQLSLINLVEGQFSLLPLTRTYVGQLLSDRPALQAATQATWLGCLRRMAHDYQVYVASWRNVPRLRRIGPHIERAFNWALDQGRLTEALALSRAVCAYLDVVGRWDELMAISVEVEAMAATDSDLIMFMALYRNWIHAQRGEIHAAWAALDHVREILTTPEQRLSYTLVCAATSRHEGNFDAAERFASEAVELLPATTDAVTLNVRANVTFERAKLARDQGDWDSAVSLLGEAAHVFDADAAATTLSEGAALAYDIERALSVQGNLGLVEHRRGNLERSAILIGRSVQIAREYGSIANLAIVLLRLADVLIDLSRPNESREALMEAQQICIQLRMHDELDECRRLAAKLPPLPVQNDVARTDAVSAAEFHADCLQQGPDASGPGSASR